MEKRSAFDTSTSPFVETLAESRVAKVERVVARGQRSKENFYCPQEASDFLVLLKGELELEYEGEKEPVLLGPGDFIVTQPGQNNRVSRTSEESETVWLKVSFMGKMRPGIFPSPDARKEQPRGRNIFAETAVIESLIETEEVRLERVISHGQRSAAAACTQGVHEWLVVLKGGTVLELDGEKRRLGPGDHVFIPAEMKNRVAETATFDETIWLAAYWKSDPDRKTAMQARFPVSTGY
ncbi:hypothetical protein [Salinarimonas rosea]|uniref:hypothetical protein n=1 Tax=Salinarimonas rosea TaxID=552063 RepID=UPI00040E3103|nr:hypothetical protein [Salinarimonas rosea]